MSKRLNFTKESLLQISVPGKGKREVYLDAKTAGLQVRVTDTGVKTFSVYRRIKGGPPERITIGRFPEVTIEQARRQAAKINADIADGGNPASVKRAHREELTFGELFTEYGERHGRKKRSWGTDQSLYANHLQPLVHRKLSLINREMVSRILSDLDRAGKAGATVNNVRALISSVFGRAIEWGHVGANPVSGIKTRPKVKRDRFLQADELPRFFESLADEPNDTLRDYFMLALLTGIRRTNLLEMEWAQVNLREAVWRVPRTKNSEPQNVTLSPEAVELLRARKDAAGDHAIYVFPGSGKSGHLAEPKSAWKRLLDRDEIRELQRRITAAGGEFSWPQQSKKATGSKGRSLETMDDALARARQQAEQAGVHTLGARLEDLHLHDLRRTLGSWQAKTGASLVIIGKSLNHKSQQATAIYARLDLDPVRQAVNAATVAMFDAAGRVPRGVDGQG